ncbi:hypothetical protein BGZ76_006005 [Entomortierella beljakovae]|nr:hypothetical protein BGZ76_006005 [Entomortierella beljakovae]
MTLPTPTQASSEVLSQAIRSNDSSYQLLYFNIHGLSELIRILFAYSGSKWGELKLAKYETKNSNHPSSWVINYQEWPAQRKHTPFECIPVVYETTADGTILELAESRAIERYLANKFDLSGKNDYEKHKVDQFVNSADAVMLQFSNKVIWVPAEERIPGINKVYSETLPKFIRVHEEHLKKNGSNGYYVGDSLTVADIKTAVVIRHLLLLQLKGSDPLPISAEKSPLLWKVYETVFDSPNIKAWKDSERYKGVDAGTIDFFKWEL